MGTNSRPPAVVESPHGPAPQAPKLPLVPTQRAASVRSQAQATATSTRAAVARLIGMVMVVAILYCASHLPHRTRMQSMVFNVASAEGVGMESEVAFQDVQMRQVSGDRLDIYGHVCNQGNHYIKRVVVQLTFRDAQGQPISSIQRPIQDRKDQERWPMTDEFSIEPDQTRFFQIVLNHVPARWDHNLPGLRVITVALGRPRW
ncbi:MAG TPA: hypothetical protein VKV05_12060 [Terriglobales bacterium]|nr:hypothetical protein [Terriglobales bacterium]